MSKPSMKEELEKNYDKLLSGWGVSQGAKEAFSKKTTVAKPNTVSKNNTVLKNTTVSNITTVKEKTTVLKKTTDTNKHTVSKINTVLKNNKILKGNTKVIFDYLQLQSQNHETGFIGYNQITKDCNIVKSTAFTLIKKLINAKYIKRLKTLNTANIKGSKYQIIKFTTV